MTLIKSISGIRGTIGGTIGDNLTPIDLVKFSAAFSTVIKRNGGDGKKKIVIGRDARLSGELVQSIVEGAVMACGIDVISIGLATTPTTEMAVTHFKADGGIILTASHNPKQWNALKLLGGNGEFLNAKEGEEILDIASKDAYKFVEIDEIGHVLDRTNFDKEHIDAVLALDMVDVEAIKRAKYKVVVDAVNSVGGVVIPQLLERLGVEVIKINCEPDGKFAHNPEPLAEHLTEISNRVVSEKACLGIVVDPDVDRLALVCEDGSMFGEENTLVAVGDYVLSKKDGNAVSNLSSSRGLADIAAKHGRQYAAGAVGEVNVVKKMKEVGAVIGGEGNGGIILPELHYGRDALVGVALFLTHLAHKNIKISELLKELPQYCMSKNRMDLAPGTDVDAILESVKKRFNTEKITDIDGVKIDFAEGWVHLRKSNTEPIIRIYSEHNTKAKADELAKMVIDTIK